jgi:hypothetical protein
VATRTIRPFKAETTNLNQPHSGTIYAAPENASSFTSRNVGNTTEAGFVHFDDRQYCLGAAPMPAKSDVYDDPSEVKAVDGKVEVDGPDAVDIAFTAEAAEETSERLLGQAFKARGQRRMKRYPHQPLDD